MSLGQLLSAPERPLWTHAAVVIFRLVTLYCCVYRCMLANDLTTSAAYTLFSALGGSDWVVIWRALFVTGRPRTRLRGGLYVGCWHSSGTILAPINRGLLLMVLDWRGIFASRRCRPDLLVKRCHFSMRETCHTGTQPNVLGNCRQFSAATANLWVTPVMTYVFDSS